MLNITNEAASAAILRVCDEGRLVQGKWHDRDREGRELACLLGAIDPSVTQPGDCNGDLMPMWLAELTPPLFDGIAAEHALPMARRYGALVARWHTISPAGWDGLRTRFLVRTIDVAVEAARPVSDGKPYWPAVAAACDQTKTALMSGEGLEAAAEATAEATAGAAEAAEAAAGAAEAAAEAAAGAAEAAAWAARAAGAAGAAAEAAEATWAAWAAGAAAGAAEAAAEAAAGAAEAAAEAAWAARAARAARAAAYLSLFTYLLDQIEAEVA